MPDIVTEDFNGGHGLKTSLVADFGRRSHKPKAIFTVFVYALLQPCVQMDTDADNHSEEGIPLFGVYTHIMKMIIIQNPVIHPLTGSAVIVNFLVFCRSSWNGSVKVDVPVWFCVDTAAIRRGGAFFLTGTGVHFAAGQWATLLTGMFLFTVPPS